MTFILDTDKYSLMLGSQRNNSGRNCTCPMVLKTCNKHRVSTEARSLAFCTVLLQYWSAETVFRHLHHPARQNFKTGFFVRLFFFRKSETHQLDLKDVIILNRNLR